MKKNPADVPSPVATRPFISQGEINSKVVLEMLHDTRKRLENLDPNGNFNFPVELETIIVMTNAMIRVLE